MTFGRNPTMVSGTAKTLRWLSTGTGWGRLAATQAAKGYPGAADAVTAGRANPFDVRRLGIPSAAVVPAGCNTAGSAALGTGGFSGAKP